MTTSNTPPAGDALELTCAHDATILHYQAEWCRDCGAFRFNDRAWSIPGQAQLAKVQARVAVLVRENGELIAELNKTRIEASERAEAADRLLEEWLDHAIGDDPVPETPEDAIRTVSAMIDDTSAHLAKGGGK